MIKPTRIEAGHYEYKGFTIERLPCGEWYTGPIGEFAQDVTSTLAEALEIVDDVTALEDADNTHTTQESTDMINYTTNESNALYVAKLNAEAADWIADNAHLLPAEEVDAGLPSMPSNKLSGKYSELDAYLNATEEGAECFNEYTATGSCSFSRESAEPSTGLGDSMADPEMLGMMSASRAEAKRADRIRKDFGIQDIVSVKVNKSHAATTTRVRRKRKSAAEKAAAIRARRNPQASVQASQQDTAPAYSVWNGRPAPYAHTDAGNGPLAIVDMPAPETLSASTDDVVRMSPIVDTIGYESGRSPFQIAQRSARNSDITG